MVSNLPFGSEPSASNRSAGSPDPRQRPFRPGHQPLSGRLSGDRRRRSQHRGHRFPVAFRPPAFASRVILRPLGHRPPSRSAYQASSRLDPIGVVTFRMRQIRPGWVPSEPRGRWCAPARPNPSGRHLPPCNGRPLSPAGASHRAGVPMTRRHRGFTCVHPSGLPQPVTPGWNRNPWAFPSGFAPRSYPRRTPRRGRSSRTGPGTTSSTSTEPPSMSVAALMRLRVARPG